MGERSKWETTVGAGALGMAVAAFTGHLVAPDRVADRYGWPRQRWYQREIGSFNAGLAVGAVLYARGHPDQAFLASWGSAALLLSATRAGALASGARSGALNAATVAGDAALGVGALSLLARARRPARAAR